MTAAAALHPPTQLAIPRRLWETMRSQAAASAPEEACGLLAGASGRVSAFRPVTNILHSPTAFRMDPAEQLRAFDDFERMGLELLAIVHSHPAGPPHPSPTDLAQATYPEQAYLIWFGKGGEWACRAFRLDLPQPVEIPIEVTADPPAG
jgi:proteasome lid subunit RPN8/RPN11